jgi:hypothetical protein
MAIMNKDSDLSDEDKEAASDLIEVIIENLEEEYRSEIEPFEQYSKRVRLHLFKQMNEYAEKFTKGHQAIMEELRKDEKK